MGSSSLTRNRTRGPLHWEHGVLPTELPGKSRQVDSLLLSHQGEGESKSHSVVSNSLQPHGLYSPWESPGQNTGVGSLSLLQGIFPTQRSSPGLPHCRQIVYQLSQKGSPRILQWVAYPFPSRFSWPRNQTRVSCTAGRFFTNWAIREALFKTGAQMGCASKTHRASPSFVLHP